MLETFHKGITNHVKGANVMAKTNCRVFEPILFPTLEPWEFVWAGMATNKYKNYDELFSLSGYSSGTWFNWLYRNTAPKRDTKEKLYRVAVVLGWIEEKPSAKAA